jgi:DMSO/TMAO reductase YedYZ molybdopterin-dependent catalytic subunit
LPASVRRRLPALEPLVVALFAGFAGVAGSYAVAGFTPSFVAGPIAGFFARVLPGQLITFAIEYLGDLGAQLNVVNALATALLVFAAAAWLAVRAAERFGTPVLASPLAAVGVAAIAYAVTGALSPSLAAGGASGVVLLLAALAGRVEQASALSPARRRLVGGGLGALALGLGSVVLGRRTTSAGEQEATLDVPSDVQADIEASLSLARERSLDVPDIEPLVSEKFFQVDINATDPVIDAEEWTLSVTGAVEEEVEYSYADIREMAPENRFSTLRCVGDQLNGKKMDNALWTGVPIMDLVDPAAPAEECCVMLRAADDFFEEFPLPALQDGFLAYGMNGKRLPKGHGFPARALIPGHWGEINVKWITEIEILREEQDGYWEQRGWHGTGPVNTVAKLYATRRLDDGRVEVGGHTYAGTRGVERVEVSTDGGTTWTPATLSEPLPGNDVWRQWQYRYDAPDGPHEVVVRAVDGTGQTQTREESGPAPSGATGWVSDTIDP